MKDKEFWAEIKKYTAKDIAIVLRVSLTISEKWVNGTGAPHKNMRPGIIETLEHYLVPKLTMESKLNLLFTINNQEFPVRAKAVNDCVIQIEVFKSASGYDQDGTNFYPKRTDAKESRSDGTTTVLDKAERMLEGTIKWDGCSDINFFPDDNGYEHFCGKEGAMVIADLIRMSYEKAWEMMPDQTDIEMFNGE